MEKINFYCDAKECGKHLERDSMTTVEVKPVGSTFRDISMVWMHLCYEHLQEFKDRYNLGNESLNKEF